MEDGFNSGKTKVNMAKFNRMDFFFFLKKENFIHKSGLIRPLFNINRLVENKSSALSAIANNSNANTKYIYMHKQSAPGSVLNAI